MKLFFMCQVKWTSIVSGYGDPKISVFTRSIIGIVISLMFKIQPYIFWHTHFQRIHFRGYFGKLFHSPFRKSAIKHYVPSRWCFPLTPSLEKNFFNCIYEHFPNVTFGRGPYPGHRGRQTLLYAILLFGVIREGSDLY